MVEVRAATNTASSEHMRAAGSPKQGQVRTGVVHFVARLGPYTYGLSSSSSFCGRLQSIDAQPIRFSANLSGHCEQM